MPYCVGYALIVFYFYGIVKINSFGVYFAWFLFTICLDAFLQIFYGLRFILPDFNGCRRGLKIEPPSKSRHLTKFADCVWTAKSWPVVIL